MTKFKKYTDKEMKEIQKDFKAKKLRNLSKIGLISPLYQLFYDDDEIENLNRIYEEKEKKIKKEKNKETFYLVGYKPKTLYSSDYNGEVRVVVGMSKNKAMKEAKNFPKPEKVNVYKIKTELVKQ